VRRLVPSDANSLFVVDFIDLGAAHVAGFFRGLPTPQQVLEVSGAAMGGSALATIPLAPPGEPEKAEPAGPIT
jgi:hypothetical protein